MPIVEVDYWQAAHQAAEFLYDNGHREIGYIGPETPTEYYVSTFGGYAAALKEHGLVCNPAWMPDVSFSEASAEAAISQVLQCPELPSAFLCAGDSFAIDVIRSAKKHGLRVPEDLSIIGLDDLFVSQYLEPPLSSVGFDKEALGKRAVETLFRIMPTFVLRMSSTSATTSTSVRIGVMTVTRLVLTPQSVMVSEIHGSVGYCLARPPVM